MQDHQHAFKRRARRLIEKPTHRVHPAIHILGLLGVRPTDIARACRVTPVVVSGWRNGVSVPRDKQSKLLIFAGHKVLAAVEALGEAVADDPDVAATESYRLYASRVAEARRQFVELQKSKEVSHGR